MKILLAVLAIFSGIGCAATRKNPTPTTWIESPTLQAEFIHEMVNLRNTLKPKRKKDITEEKIRASVATVSKHYPYFFLVTSDQERRFRAGLYDDKTNHAVVTVLLPNLQKLALQYDTSFHTLLLHLIREHQQTPLHSARLELMRRLVEYMFWYIPRS